jgi:hypothetical protein
VYEGDHAVITCPVRFRQNWIIATDAASFFFPAGRRCTSLTEVRLEDKHGRSAGNIDVVLVAYDDRGQIIDFGALEVQAVYISGSSSSRGQLAPQLIHKGGILHAWGKKLAVAVDRHFLADLPPLPEAGPDEAEIAWLVYDLVLDPGQNRYELVKQQTAYTRFLAATDDFAGAEVGPVEDFINRLDVAFDEVAIDDD